VIRFVFYLLLVAAVLYAVFWAIDRRNTGGSTQPPARPRPRGPVGPDDDESFLRDLDRDRRRGNPRPPSGPNSVPPTSQENHDHPE
jgi:hypothetical protein